MGAVTETTTGRPEWLPPETEREQAIRLAEEAFDLADRRRTECELAVYEAKRWGNCSYARMLRARLDGDQAGKRIAEIEWYADLHESTGAPPPKELADEVTVLLAERRLAREH